MARFVLLAILGLLGCFAHPCITFLVSQTQCDVELPDERCTCHRFRAMHIDCAGLHMDRWPDFVSMGNLSIESMDISDNSFTEIPANAFGSLEIQHLALARNEETFQFVSSMVFSDNQKSLIQSLDLSGNSFDLVPSFVKSLQELKKLNLKGTRIKYLGGDSFRGQLTELTDLHLGAVQSIRGQVFREIPSLKLLEIIPMPTGSETALSQFYKNKNVRYLRDTETLILSGMRKITFEDDYFFQSVPSLLHLEMSNCSITNADLDAINMRRPYDSMTYLDLSQNHITFVPRRFLSRFEYLQHLDLSYNDVLELSPRDFYKNTALEYLSLRHNDIVALPDRIFIGMPFLKELDLRDNLLATVSSNDFPEHFNYGMYAHLGNNQWWCDCDLMWLMEICNQQHHGYAGPLDPYEVENQLICYNIKDESPTYLYQAYENVPFNCESSNSK